MSFYTSLNGLKNAQTDLGVIAHNIANVETNGFKKGRTEFADLVVSSAQSNPRMIQGIGARVEAITQNFALGPVEQTGGGLDIAIAGDGFFETQSPGGKTFYTRNGAFGIDGAGFIVDNSGNRLQVFPTDANGNVTSMNPVGAQIPAVNGTAEFAGVSVAENGHIVATYADGSNLYVGTAAVANFIAPTGLKQVGSSNWQSTGLSGAASYGIPGEGAYGSLLAGALERSNVDIAEELVGLITAQRNFQANAKAIDTASQVSQAIMNLRT
jgi:flagellar hook protein FlgE